MAWKGRYKVKNPAKYKGDPTRVIYRSSLELKFMNFLDTHSDIIEWNSEEVVVPYRINEVMTWGKNQSKWKAAEEYCKDRGWKFQIITEKELNS